MSNRHTVTSEEIQYNAPPTLSSFTDVTGSLSTFQPQATLTEQCTICWEPLSKETCATIISCSHNFHLKCINECLRRGPRCPVCRQPIRAPQGTCPSGTMNIILADMDCPGYNGAKTIGIKYEMPPGLQAPYHDNPGCRYWPTYRLAFLPNTEEGRRLLSRLKYAWTCGLIFTVGTSLTTGHSNAIVWTSILHKTSLWGGPYSFPDPNYISNCNGSLDALCVPDADTCLQRLQNNMPNDDDDDDIKEEITYDAPTSMSSSPFVAPAFSPVGDNTAGDCAVCLEQIDKQSICIHKCSHMFHRKCIDDCMDQKLSCPVCREPVGDSPQGKSPSGSMKIKTLKQRCPGSTSDNTIQIEYRIPQGTQKSYQQHEGFSYRGTVRVAYIPKDNEGIRLLSRIKYAWKHGLVFNIGTSLTSGRHNVVVWAGINHKTSLHAGEHGFPDSDYFTKCNTSLDNVRVPRAEECA